MKNTMTDERDGEVTFELNIPHKDGSAKSNAPTPIYVSQNTTMDVVYVASV